MCKVGGTFLLWKAMLITCIKAIILNNVMLCTWCYITVTKAQSTIIEHVWSVFVKEIDEIRNPCLCIDVCSVVFSSVFNVNWSLSNNHTHRHRKCPRLGWSNNVVSPSLSRGTWSWMCTHLLTALPNSLPHFSAARRSNCITFGHKSANRAQLFLTRKIALSVKNWV